MNNFVKGLETAANFTYTENGDLTHKSTLSKVLDLFAFGGAYRQRSEEDCISLLKEAYNENSELALKCLFYLRDILGGQGERRFFRIGLKWLANTTPSTVYNVLEKIPEFGRFDDLYCLVDTPVEKDMFRFMLITLAKDTESENPSLAAKWLKSENCSSRKSKILATKTRKALGLNSKEYRKLLSKLRKKIKIVETQMSQDHWDEIEFDKLPSIAGFRYSTAFATNPKTAERYSEFIHSKKTKVNAKTLFPYEIIERAINDVRGIKYKEPEVLNKYWDNLPDYYNGREENAIAIVDISGSMMWNPSNRVTPLHAAIAMGLIIADKSKGPFAGKMITFSEDPEIIEIKGSNIIDKVKECNGAAWGMNTDIKKVFNLLLDVAISNNVPQEDLPKRLYIFSDMEFDEAVTEEFNKETFFEKEKKLWADYGYTIPNVVFWNLNARHNCIPAIGEGFSFVSGFSMNLLETILSGKDGYDLMLEKLLSDRYKDIKM